MMCQKVSSFHCDLMSQQLLLLLCMYFHLEFFECFEEADFSLFCSHSLFQYFLGFDLILLPFLPRFPPIFNP